MRFEFFIATRYLRAKRRQAVIGVITGHLHRRGRRRSGVAGGGSRHQQRLPSGPAGPAAGLDFAHQSSARRERRHQGLASADGAFIEAAARGRHRACDLRTGVDLARTTGPRGGAERHDSCLRAQGQRSAEHGEDWIDGSVGHGPCGAGSSTRPGRVGDPPRHTNSVS